MWVVSANTQFATVTEKTISEVHVSPGSGETLARKSGISNHQSIVHSLSNISAKNYWNRLMCVEVILCNISVVFRQRTVLYTTTTTTTTTITTATTTTTNRCDQSILVHVFISFKSWAAGGRRPPSKTWNSHISDDTCDIPPACRPSTSFRGNSTVDVCDDDPAVIWHDVLLHALPIFRRFCILAAADTLNRDVGLRSLNKVPQCLLTTTPMVDCTVEWTRISERKSLETA